MLPLAKMRFEQRKPTGSERRLYDNHIEMPNARRRGADIG